MELFAQLAAAHSGYTALLDQQSQKEGFLVGVRELTVEEINTGVPIRVEMEKLEAIDKITFVRGNGLQNGELIAQGMISLWESEAAGVPVDVPAAVDGSSTGCGSWSPPTRWQPRGELDRAILDCCRESSEMAASGFEVDLVFPETYIGFEGHFPGYPLLPGVIQLKTVKLLSQLALGRDLALKRLEYAKFKERALPANRLRTEGKLTQIDRNSWSLTARISSAGKLCLRSEMMLQASESAQGEG